MQSDRPESASSGPKEGVVVNIFPSPSSRLYLVPMQSGKGIKGMVSRLGTAIGCKILL